MSKDNNGSLISALIVLFFIIGWCMNLYKLCTSDFDTITGMLIARIIGALTFIPGAILGWF